MVVFIHRQEKFGIPTFDDGSSTRGIAEIILAKNRNGPVDDVKLRFREERAQFVDLDEFDLEGMEEGKTPQSFTFGSKMNNDSFGQRNGTIENDFDLGGEPPFA